jgi:hypothetical protein
VGGAHSPHRQHRADHGRDRHRQRPGGTRGPRLQRPAPNAVCGGQLCGLNRAAAGIGAVRPRQRARSGAVGSRLARFQRADRRTIFLDEKSARCGSTCRPSCCASCRSAKSSRSAGKSVGHRRPGHRSHQPRSEKVRCGGPLPGGFVLSPQRHPDQDTGTARSPRGHPRARRSVRRQARAAKRQGGSSGWRPDCVLAAVARLIGERPGTREHDRTRGGSECRANDRRVRPDARAVRAHANKPDARPSDCARTWSGPNARRSVTHCACPREASGRDVDGHQSAGALLLSGGTSSPTPRARSPMHRL